MYTEPECARKLGVSLSTWRRNHRFGLTSVLLGQRLRLWDADEVGSLALDLTGRRRGDRTKPYLLRAERERAAHEQRLRDQHCNGVVPTSGGN